MIPQTYPLYTTRNGRPFLVVGWREANTGNFMPILAPLEQPGPVQPIGGGDLTFSTTPPAHETATQVMSAYCPPRPVHHWPPA